MPSYFKNIYSSFRFKNPAATNTSDAPSQTTISPIPLAIPVINFFIFLEGNTRGKQTIESTITPIERIIIIVLTVRTPIIFL